MDFISQAVERNSVPKEAWKELQTAAANGNSDVVRKILLSNYQHISIFDKMVAMKCAATNGHLDVMETLIKVYAECNELEKPGLCLPNVLKYAAANDRVEIVKFMLDKISEECFQATSVNYIQYAFVEACRTGSHDVIKFFIDEKIDLIKPPEHFHITSWLDKGLMTAATYGRKDTVIMLIEHAGEFISGYRKAKALFEFVPPSIFMSGRPDNYETYLKDLAEGDTSLWDGEYLSHCQGFLDLAIYLFTDDSNTHCHSTDDKAHLLYIIKQFLQDLKTLEEKGVDLELDKDLPAVRGECSNNRVSPKIQ